MLGSESQRGAELNEPSILAVVLNWRQPDMTIECVKALREMEGPELDILVIDNGSGDGSAEILNERLSQTSFQALPENIGFAAGSNIGLRRALEGSYDFALLVNNDAFPSADVMIKLLDESTDEIALLSPKILIESTPSRIWFAGGRQHPRLLEMRDRGLGELDGPEWSVSRDVNYLLGTFLLVNLSAVSRTGFLDERYFMYYEDLDWSIRFRQDDYRLRMVADACVYHRVSTSTGGTENPINRYYLARSSVLFFSSYAKMGKPISIIFYRLGSALKMIGKLLLGGQISGSQAYIRGLIDGIGLAQADSE